MTTRREGIFNRFKRVEPGEEAGFCWNEFVTQAKEAWKHQSENGDFPGERFKAFLDALEEAMRLDAKRDDLWESFHADLSRLLLPILNRGDARKKREKGKSTRK